MIKLYAEKITSFLICNKTIDPKDYNIYLYGFETLIAFLVNISVILTIGFTFGRFVHTLLFLGCYCPIRQFAGGYHADNYKKCLFVFIIIYLINILLLNNLRYKNMNEIILGVTFMSYIGIWILAPREHRNNPLSYKEKSHYKNVVRCLISVILISVLIGIDIKYVYEYALYAASAIVWTFIMLNLAILKDYRRYKNMKSILNIILKQIGSLAVSTLSISANTTSNWMAHQPKVPEEVKQFKKR